MPRQVYDPRNCQLGSIVGVNRGLYQHVGILVLHPMWGLAVISFTPGGIIQQPVQEFTLGKPFDSCAYPSNTPWPEVVWRAQMAVAQRPYHWWKFNCDYFVRYCHGLKMESPQVEAATTMVGLAVFAGIAVAATTR
jgi:hypothetical protein